VTALLWVQIALGGWVSTNYAVLACTGFPTCNGQWWPAMNFDEGFTLLRELGRTDEGSFIPMDALVAIHMVHRIVALVLFAGLCALAWRLWTGADAALRRTAAGAFGRGGGAGGGDHLADCSGAGRPAPGRRGGAACRRRSACGAGLLESAPNPWLPPLFPWRLRPADGRSSTR
jgi:hypothetical protein